MKTFVISTNSEQIKLGIFDRLKKLTESSSKKEHTASKAENLKTISEALFTKAKINLSQIELIIVVLGPGSYTGSRSGLSFAKAISQGADIKILGVSALDVIASNSKQSEFPLTIALEAGGDRFYTKTFKTIEGIFSSREEGKIQELDSTVKDKIIKTNKHPDLDEINSFGLQYFDKNGPDDFMKLLPLYLQEPNITQPKKANG